MNRNKKLRKEIAQSKISYPDTSSKTKWEPFEDAAVVIRQDDGSYYVSSVFFTEHRIKGSWDSKRKKFFKVTFDFDLVRPNYRISFSGAIRMDVYRKDPQRSLGLYTYEHYKNAIFTEQEIDDSLFIFYEDRNLDCLFSEFYDVTIIKNGSIICKLENVTELSKWIDLNRIEFMRAADGKHRFPRECWIWENGQEYNTKVPEFIEIPEDHIKNEQEEIYYYFYNKLHGHLEFDFKNKLIKESEQIQKLISNNQEPEGWISNDDIPDALDFYYNYPDGRRGDINEFIAKAYGKVEHVKGRIYKTTIPTKNKPEIDCLIEPPLEGDATGSYFAPGILLPTEESLFLWNSNKAFSRFRMIHSFVYYYRAVRNLIQRLYPDDDNKDMLLANSEKDILEMQDEIYETLVANGKSTGKWISEQKLYGLIRDVFPDAKYQYKAEWLGRQSLDVFVPSANIGFEYQGVQHYEPVEVFGGQEGLKTRQLLDEKKRKVCRENNVTLIEWPYTVDVTSSELQRLLSIHQNKV